MLTSVKFSKILGYFIILQGLYTYFFLWGIWPLGITIASIALHEMPPPSMLFALMEQILALFIGISLIQQKKSAIYQLGLLILIQIGTLLTSNLPSGQTYRYLLQKDLGFKVIWLLFLAGSFIWLYLQRGRTANIRGK